MTVSSFHDAAHLKRLREAFAQSGWQLDVARGACARFDGPTIYLCDVDSGKLFVVVTATEAFPLVASEASCQGTSFEDACNALGSIIAELAAGRIPLNPDNRQFLNLAAILYIQQTHSYKIAMSTADFRHPHFLVLHYPDQTGAGLLRPTPLSSEKPLTPETIEIMANRVLSHDRVKHPERFRSAKILPFRISQRQEV